MFINDLFNDKDKPLNEVSNELLDRYKKAAGADATAADQRGDIERGNKRFRGIVKATVKQGENDVKRHKAQGVAEGQADQVKKIVKKNGKPVGEIGTDPEASPGNGNWYVKHYASGYDVVGFDNAEEALAELKHCMKQGVAEGKKKSDTYHIVNKDGKPANLASYADKESAVKDRDAKHQGAEVRQLGPRGKVKGVAEGMKAQDLAMYCEKLVAEKGWNAAYKHALMMANVGRDPAWNGVLKYIDAMKDGVTEAQPAPTTTQPAPTPAQTNTFNAVNAAVGPAVNQMTQAGEKWQAGNKVSGVVDAAKAVNNVANAAGMTFGDKAAVLGSAVKGGYHALKAHVTGNDPGAAFAGSVASNLTQPYADYTNSENFVSDFNAGMSNGGVGNTNPKLQKAYDNNLVDANSVRNAANSMNKTANQLKSGDASAMQNFEPPSLYRDDFGAYNEINKRNAITQKPIQTKAEIRAANPIFEVTSAATTPTPTPPLNVPKGWEAKTQADGSTRISKQGSMSSADYKQNMANYKAQNWTPEKMADYGQRMASGQGYTDAEKTANYQQQQKSFGQYADQPIQGVDESGHGRNRGYTPGFASSTAPRLGGRRQNDEPDAVNNIEVSINGRPWKIFAGKGSDSSPEFFRQKKAMDAMCKRKTLETGKEWSWGVTGAATTNEGKCNMTEQGRSCPEHDMMECPGYGRLMGEAFKMPPESLQDRMHRHHQELRKKRGLPDPSHYKELAKKKQQEIDALRAEIAADKDNGLTEERYLEELQRAGYDLITEKKTKQRLDPKCWTGYKKQGTKIKGGVRVNNCVPKK